MTDLATAELTLLAAARAVLASAEYDPDQARVDPDALEVLETVCASYPALPAVDAPAQAVPTETSPNSPSPGLTVLGSPTAGLDTHLVCAQCERTRSVRLAHTVNHWPMCCGQPMAIAATRAEVLLLPENEEEIDYALEGHWPWEEGAE